VGKLIIPVPAAVRKALAACANENGVAAGVHPGLVLDKFAPSLDESGDWRGLSERVQKPVIDQVVALSVDSPPGLQFDELVRRWERLTDLPNAIVVTGVTDGPLTLHLARASALENAGICLHPIYGFTYLPGSGLKGLAHAYACEVWFPGQSNKPVAWQTICRVFGVAPSGWLSDLAKRLGVPPPPDSVAGSAVFHDGWPRKWPKLTVDILNSHHIKYYANGEAPGDWEDPVPVYFLSVQSGVPFRFVLSPRRDDVGSDDLKLAADWLSGGLTVLGCGAKTATGYGYFTTDRNVLTTSTGPAEFALELATPAFLAGAMQEAEDCNLRPATLRGLLRWWWRTMHAGFVDVATLRRMEAAIWGDTKRGGTVRIRLSPVTTAEPIPYARTDIISRNHLPRPQASKTSQGLTYHSYGMDDHPRPRRFFVKPGTKWSLVITAQAGVFSGSTDKKLPVELPAQLLLEQATAALELLCHFGGCGAKSRKGFGSFVDQSDFDLGRIKLSATEFRTHCLSGSVEFQASLAQSASLEQLLGPVEVPSNGTNYWLVLDQLAAAAQEFAKTYRHRREKKALGLPRDLRNGETGEFHPGRHVKNRHASPVLYHVARDAGGKLLARVIGFPATELPNLADSSAILGQLLNHLTNTLGGRFEVNVANKPAAALSAP